MSSLSFSFLLLLVFITGCCWSQNLGRLIDDDTIVTEAASDEEMQEVHSRSKRQTMQMQMIPSYGQQFSQQPQTNQWQQQQRQQITWGPIQQSRMIELPQQQQWNPQTVMQPQQQLQQRNPQPIMPQQKQGARVARAHPQLQANDETCKTSRGEIGTCVTLAECYPYITFNNQATIDLLLKISTSCSSDSAPNVIFTQNPGSQQRPQAQFLQKSQTICCAGGQPIKNPPPQQQQQQIPPSTTTRPIQHQYPTQRPPFQQQEQQQQFPERKWDKSVLPPYLQALVPPNSTPVPIQKYPWTVAIMNGERHHCGGSLLSKYTVLTAAHCVHALDSFAIANLRVLLGHHDISSGARPQTVTRRVIKSIYHSQFSMRTLHNDIALLILDQAAPTESVKISPVTLAVEPVSSGTVTIAGWGQMGWNLPATPMLMETTIEVWNNRKCAAVYGALAPGGITNNMICGTAVGKDACRGDSGGPLMMKKAYGYEQIGVVSWGIECGRYPSVHTRISSFLPWIQKNKVD